jgi:hypothetical protein
MERIFYLVADWMALWRDLPRAPRQVLLNRAHLSGSTKVILACMVADLLSPYPAVTVAVYVALCVLGPSSLVAVTGAVAHILWGRGRLWGDLECEFCSGPDDGGWDEGPETDGPDGGDDLIREITDYLRTRAHATV